MALPRYHWRDFGTVGTLSFSARSLFLFCGVLGSLFAIDMLKPSQEAVIQPFTRLLSALSAAIILPIDDQSSLRGAACEMRLAGLPYRSERVAMALR